MSEMKTGDKAPSFSAPDDSGNSLTLKDFIGRKLVLYFYPKDDTSGCTKEACSFTESIAQFNKLDCAVVGVSKDSASSHKKFKEKYGLNFPLLSDEDCKICTDYGVWVEKSMYGRKYMGIERSTFLIDEQGKISAVWRKVKVPGHVEEVLAHLKK